MSLRKHLVGTAIALAYAAAGVQVVETGEVALVGTNGLDAVQNETLMIEGTLRKAGAGTLTIPLERIWAGNGTLDVRACYRRKSPRTSSRRRRSGWTPR